MGVIFVYVLFTVSPCTSHTCYAPPIDQLRHVDSQMDVIHTDIQQAERNLEEMDKCCGLCVLPWKRSKKPTSDKLFKQPNSNNQSLVAPSMQTSQRQQQQFNTQPTGQPQLGIPGQGQYITRITNDAREDEMDTNLQAVASAVGGLRLMATDMNQEIRTHQDILERIDQKADANQERLRQAQTRAERLLGQPKPKTESGPSTTSVGLTAAKYLM
ncbi:synaptosomal-associated protein 23 [Paragonimus westermani]|uniref:Synaptosomal-associated protein 23 n=1 Tax=Paragonimus westermani TaxID=34504 RepID=A0A5J4NJ28_9TREM|nr:synaptosomal-associated protein 23 [Paragonimus westermani]